MPVTAPHSAPPASSNTRRGAPLAGSAAASASAKKAPSARTRKRSAPCRGDPSWYVCDGSIRPDLVVDKPGDSKGLHQNGTATTGGGGKPRRPCGILRTLFPGRTLYDHEPAQVLAPSVPGPAAWRLWPERPPAAAAGTRRDGVCPMSAFQYREHQLYAEDVPLAAIAAEYGTPCFVYSRSQLE